jgi:hypothetical protein
MTTESAAEPTTRQAFAPARALWTFAGILFTVCLAAGVFIALPRSQNAFGTVCDQNGCSYPPLVAIGQIVGFIAPSVMIAALLIAALAIVAGTINRYGGIRVGGASESAGGRDADARDRRDRDADADAELDELLGAATDDIGRARSRGAGTWRGGDLTPFMRPPGHDGRD